MVPYLEGKNVAVIGGGNSGLETALDLAGITKHVTVLGFLPELRGGWSLTGASC